MEVIFFALVLLFVSFLLAFWSLKRERLRKKEAEEVREELKRERVIFGQHQTVQPIGSQGDELEPSSLSDDSSSKSS